MCEGKSVGILIINRAMYRPVTFKKVDYIRVGSYTKKLDDYPSIQGTVWDKIRNQKFEDQYAQTDLNEEEIVQALNYITYFDLLENKLPLPNNVSNIIYYLSQANLIVKQDNGLYGITNLGALLLAKKLSYFKKLKRKMLRVVQYNGSNKMDLLRDETFDKGYAAIFEDAIQFIEALTPMKEVITNGIRKRKTAYPTAAIREILANSLIHQDFSISGTGPLVEIFDNRIEITNPGAPLIDIMRIIDTPPKSRNEKLASLMRELGICEEVGSGWDKVILSCELMQLPAPRIEIFEDATRVTIFSEIKFSDLTLEDRLWACYLHACIKYVQGEQISNHTLRERFGLKQTGSGSISRLIKEAVKQNYIKPVDPDTAPRYMKYIPSWA
ncbi:ATP-binding protein [uncultured Megasphaera sp.]|uniref:ATP-binding protein n=2 Tax=uncultured Megasphaera sp. TaxID=165188 RepID=UPI0025E85C0F|nr:ATP-binding protein [uncultured Megasphaera sp.]